MDESNITFWGLFTKQRSMIVFIVGITALVFWQIIIPINNIQIQLSSIQSQLSTSGQLYLSIRQDTDNLKLTVTTLQAEVSNLEKILKQ